MKEQRAPGQPRQNRHAPAFKGYVKQSDESSRLVPGAQDRVEVLVWMFRAYEQGRWDYHRIAQRLNGRNVPSPSGTTWSLTSVRTILFNPIYLGIEVRHRWSGALYNKIGADGPAPVYVDQDRLEKEGRRSVLLKERAREEWRLVDVPYLLPPDLREAAALRIMKPLDPTTPPHPRKGTPVQLGRGQT